MKKFLSISLVWLMAIMFGLPPQSMRAQTVWDGTSDTTWYDANVSSYNINTAEELAGVALLVNLGRTSFEGKTIMLMNDIWLNQNAGDTQNNWIPIGGAPSASGETGGSINYFRGHVDGNEHTIYNMYCNRSGNFQAGFIAAWGSTADTLIIKDLAFANPYVTARGMMGVIVGFVSGSGKFMINDCITMNVTLVGNTTVDGENNIGSILGAGWPNNAPGHVYIHRCASTGTLSGNYVGGLTGNTDRTTLNNCYFAGTVTHGANATAWGGISAYSGTRYSCYSNTLCGSNGSSGTIKDTTYMQSSAFIADLGPSFKMDRCNFNGGFPLLSWQICGVQVEGTLALCNGESTTLTASGFDSYSWSTGNTTESITVSPTTTTTYYITGTKTSGLSAEDSVTVTVYPQAVINATAIAGTDGNVHGTVTPEVSYVSCGGTDLVTLTITPDSGYHIAQIVMNDSILRADDPTDGEVVTYAVNPNGTLAEVEVYFSNLYSITATLWSDDTTSFLNAHLLTPWGTDGVYTTNQYADVEYHFFENARYHIVDVMINDVSQGPIQTYTFSHLDRNGNTVKVYYQDTCGILALPFADNFDSYAASTMPDCWSKLGGDNYSPSINSYNAYSAPNRMSFYNYNTSYAILPVIDTLVYPINTLQVSYKLNTGSTSINFEVGVMTDPTNAATFTSISSMHNTATNTWQSHLVYLSNFTGNGQYLAFRWAGSSSNTYCYMDNLEIAVAPDCSPVLDVTVTDVTYDNVNSGSATVNWKPGVIGTPSSYTLEYKTVDETDWVSVPSLTDTTYPISGLLPGTGYDVRVSSDCGTSTMSDWVYSSCFIPCDSSDMCNYSFILGDSFGDGWNGARLDIYCDGTLTNSLTMQNGSHSNTQLIALCDNVSVQLVWKKGSYNNECSFSITNPFGIELFKCSAGNASSYSDNQVLYAATLSCAPPQCIRPDSVVVVGGVTTAEVSWTDAGTTSQSWLIEYGPAGFTRGTGTVEEAYSSPYTLNGLDSNANYSVFVRTFCGEGDTSIYTDRVNFKTYLCDAVDRCNYTFRLHDSYGDGWNGNSIAVYDNGRPITTMTISSGNSATYDISLCHTDTITLVWSSGSYSDEASFTVHNFYYDDVIYTCSNGSSLTSGATFFTFVADCTLPTCVRPENVQASAITQTSADLGWTEMGTAGSWIIEYDTTGFTLGTGIVATASSNPYPLTGLTSSTRYDVYVRADCGSGDTSLWSGVYTFSTACGDITTLPFTENFDGNNIYYDNDNHEYLYCWNKYTSNAEHFVYVPTASNAFSAPRVLDFHYTPNCYVMAILPPFDPSISVNALTVTFQSRTASNTAGVKEIGVLSDPDDATTYQRVAIINHSANNTWEEFEIPMTAYTGTGSAIAFKYSNGGSNQFLIDNVVVDYTPSCMSPVSLTTSGATTTTMDLAWTERGTATAWNIEYGPAGFTHGTGTIVPATTNPYQITGLLPGTAYDFYVQSDCGGGDVSAWCDMVSAVTMCESVTSFPYTEDFENGGDMPVCWSQSYVSASVNWTYHAGNSSSYSSVNTAHSGSYNALFVTTNSNHNKTKLISPIFDLTQITNPYVSFWHSQLIWGNDQDRLIVYYKTNATDTWTQLVEYTSNISSWTFDSLALPNPSATYQIAFEGDAAYGYGVTLDDITIASANSVATTCDAPTGLASAVTTTTATLSWTETGNFEVAYKLTSAADWSANTAVAGSTTTLTALTANTAYDWRVRKVCDASTNSDWATGTFTTSAEAICPMPTDLAVTAVDSNSATIAWTQEAGTATEWTLNYRRAETGATWTTSTISTNPYTILDLTGLTAYEVQIRANCPNGTFSEYTPVVSFTTTSINDYNLSNSISLYPNPTTSYIEVKFSDNIQVSELKVYDVYGKLLQTITVNNNPTRINVSALADGVYFVRAVTENGIANKSFIKR